MQIMTVCFSFSNVLKYKNFILDIYRETIPNNAPPSYRGQCIKYAYKITVGTQRVNAVIKLLKIPIRVLVLYGMY